MSQAAIASLAMMKPSTDAFDVTPGSSALTRPARALYVGGAGDVEITTPSGTTVVFHSVAAGTFMPVQATHVIDTNTTATDIVALV